MSRAMPRQMPRAASRHILFTCEHYSTSDLFPTWALLDVGSVPDASLVRSMRASKNSSPAAMRSDLCCATSCAHKCVARSDLCCRGTAHVCDSAEDVRKYFPSVITWMFVCASAGALHKWATVPTLAKHTSFGHKYFCKPALVQACEGLRRLRSLAQCMLEPKMIKIIKRPSGSHLIPELAKKSNK